MSIIQLQKILKAGNGDRLEKLVQRAQDMDRLTATLKSALEAELLPHLVAANLRPDGTLVLLVDSSGWAARFRYESERLAQMARDGGSNVRSCRVAVAREPGASALAGADRDGPERGRDR